jgi:hypothetical protein
MDRAVSGTSTSSTSRSPIQRLPPEVLLIIFNFAYVSVRFSMSGSIPTTACPKATCSAEDKSFCYHSPREKYDWDMDKDSPPTILFPNSIASVCSHWGKVMLLTSVFWMRLAISLDSSTFPPPHLHLQLDSARDGPIDIVVTRTGKSSTVDAGIEKSRMAYAVTALHPHFRRFRKLNFEVVHSSSLPRLPGLLQPVMPYLEELSLEGFIDTGSPEVHFNDQPDKASIVTWHALRNVVIDGWNFVGLYQSAPLPSEQIFSACQSLAMKFGGDES